MVELVVALVSTSDNRRDAVDFSERRLTLSCAFGEDRRKEEISVADDRSGDVCVARLIILFAGSGDRVGVTGRSFAGEFLTSMLSRPVPNFAFGDLGGVINSSSPSSTIFSGTATSDVEHELPAWAIPSADDFVRRRLTTLVFPRLPLCPRECLPAPRPRPDIAEWELMRDGREEK